MQNPFVRLKNYRRDVTDPLENHATETLAACLSFSENIKREFIRFLFDGKKTPFTDWPTFEVLTQQPSPYGIVDLLLEAPEAFNIVVEVKVNAPQDDRHGRQIRHYREWLDDAKRGTNFV